MTKLHYLGMGRIEEESLIVPEPFIDLGFPATSQVILGQDRMTEYPILGVTGEVATELVSTINIKIEDHKLKIPRQYFSEEVINSNDGLHFVATEEMLDISISSYTLSNDQLREFVTEDDCWATQKDVERLRDNGLTKRGTSIKSIESGSKLDFDKYEFSDNSQTNNIYTNLSSITEVLQLSETVDSEIRPKIRVALRDLEEHGFASDLYKSAIEGKIRQNYGISLEKMLKSLKKEDSLTDDLTSIDPDLTIEISDGLSAIEFGTDRTSLEIEAPELLWDCHCERPDGEYSSGQRPEDADEFQCPIHQHPYGDELRTKFLEGIVLIKYKNIEVLWYNVPDFWPVSADSIHMYDNLENEGIFSNPFNSVLDVGCGTGFLGIGAIRNNPEIRHLSMSDWLLTPLVFSRINWERNYGDMIKHASYEPRLGLGFDWIRRKNDLHDHFDLCVCNPPYLPEVEEYPEVNMQHAVGGTDLLEKVITDGKDIADRIFVNFSDLALPEAKSAAEDSGVELKQVGQEHNVPFRVRSALRSDGYMSELKSRNIEIRNQGRYKYWHTVRTYEIQRS